MEEVEIQRRIVKLIRDGSIKYLEGGRYTMRCMDEPNYTLVQVNDTNTDMYWNAVILRAEIDDELLGRLHYALHTLNETSNRLYYRGTILQNTLASADIEFINNNLALTNRSLAFEEVQVLDVDLTHYEVDTHIL